MRILMTADAVGGVWTYALELSGALARRGVEVHVATMGTPPGRSARQAAAAAGVAALHESRFRLEWEDDPWADVDRAGTWLLELASTHDADLVQLNGYVHAALGWEVPVVVVAHSDVLSWWRAVRLDEPPPHLDRYREGVEEGLRAADLVCAPTRAVLDDLASGYRFSTETTVVPHGRTAPATAAAKEALVVALGRFWDEAKNVAALDRVATRSPWPVVVAGPGTRVGPLGPAEAARLLRRASIFAAPARYEPFGLAALEAAQAGCALLLGDIPSLREVWADAAVYVPPDDDEAIVAALRDLCADDRRRGALAARAHERAAMYTPAAMAQRMLALYERVLARSALGAAR
jgi:glycosyltransferase involved in cell wall biosynthesis